MEIRCRRFSAESFLHVATRGGKVCLQKHTSGRHPSAASGLQFSFFLQPLLHTTVKADVHIFFGATDVLGESCQQGRRLPRLDEQTLCQRHTFNAHCSFLSNCRGIIKISCIPSTFHQGIMYRRLPTLAANCNIFARRA
jgi:hypothetical protein